MSPILIDAGPARNTAITLTNNEPRPVNAQVRVFKWALRDGKDDLVPTDDVVVSPPIVAISAHESYVVRLQRLTGDEPKSEEAYRVVVDELPNPNRQRNGTVAVVMRYVVPAFFFSPDASQARIRWSLGSRNGRQLIIAENTGDKRVQLTDLSIKSNTGMRSVAKGLAGYVLGHSYREWPLSTRIASARQGTVVANSDTGTIRAPLTR